MLITITKQSAEVLVLICQQVNVAGAQAKIQLGTAQAELEAGLAALQADTPPDGKDK